MLDGGAHHVVLVDEVVHAVGVEQRASAVEEQAGEALGVAHHLADATSAAAAAATRGVNMAIERVHSDRIGVLLERAGRVELARVPGLDEAVRGAAAHEQVFALKDHTRDRSGALVGRRRGGGGGWRREDVIGRRRP